MNRKVLVMSTALFVIAMLSTSVYAIGPQNAEKSNNPNINFTGDSVQIFTPGGVKNEWIIEYPSHVQIKPATTFHIGNAYTPASYSEILYNKWNYLSEEVFEEFLISVGFAPGQAYYISHVLNPGGVYYKEVYVGN